MIPEGLEWQSVDEILDDIKGVGWNYIRMYVFIKLIRAISLITTGVTPLR